MCGILYRKKVLLLVYKSLTAKANAHSNARQKKFNRIRPLLSPSILQMGFYAKAFKQRKRESLLEVQPIAAFHF